MPAPGLIVTGSIVPLGVFGGHIGIMEKKKEATF